MRGAERGDDTMKTQPVGGAAQHIAADRTELPIGSEKAHDPLGLLKRLDKSVQQDPVKTPIAKKRMLSL